MNAPPAAAPPTVARAVLRKLRRTVRG